MTLGNQITWAAQAFVAPELLEGLVPLYVYKTDDSNAGSTRSELENVPAHADLHLGVVIHMMSDREDQEEIWRARPYRSPTEFENLLAVVLDDGNVAEAENGDVDSLCIVSSRRFRDVPEVESLWIPESDWQNGLAHVQ